MILSISIDSRSEAAAYKKAAAAGISWYSWTTFRSASCPARTYVGRSLGQLAERRLAADQVVGAIGKRGEVGVITLVYDCFWSVAAPKGGALAAFKAYLDIKVLDVHIFTAPAKAYDVATASPTACLDVWSQNVV